MKSNAKPELGGSFRAVGAVVDNYDFPLYFGAGNSTDAIMQSALRLTAEGSRKGWDYEVHAVQSFDVSTAPGGQSASSLGLLDRGGGYRAADADLDWLREGDGSASFGIDRMNARYSFPKADLTIGRQAITFGKAYFWNPLDVFSPFDPRQFDREYKPGADAVRLDVALGDFSGITLVGALGREPGGAPKSVAASWDGSAALARYFANKNGWDYSIQGGKIYGGHQLGGGAVGEIGSLEFRAEAARFWARDSDPLPFPLAGDLYRDNCEAVVGIGRRYDNSFTWEMEYLYNGAGDDDRLDASLYRTSAGAALHMSEQFVGAMVSYEFQPILIGRLVLLNALSDQSIQIQPSFTKSLSNESDLLVGASLNFGPRPDGFSGPLGGVRSEFGVSPNLLFAEYKKYF